MKTAENLNLLSIFNEDNDTPLGLLTKEMDDMQVSTIMNANMPFLEGLVTREAHRIVGEIDDETIRVALVTMQPFRQPKISKEFKTELVFEVDKLEYPLMLKGAVLAWLMFKLHHDIGQALSQRVAVLRKED